MSRRHTQMNAQRWGILRRVVFERDNWRCVECGRAGRLEADHIVRLEDDPDQDPYDPNGLRTLCRSCHIAKTARENRRPLAPAELRWRVLVTELS